MAKQVTAEIKNGEVVLTVGGVKGKACKELTAEYERACGTLVESKDTKEMTERPLRQDNNARQTN